MAILVTGVCGMIGGQVAEALRARGEEVVGYDARQPPDDDRIAGVDYVRGDLNDPPRLYGTFRRFPIRKVVHAGAISAPFLEADNPYLVCQTNILGTLSVFEAARVFGVERVVNFSSEAAYGTVSAPTIGEDTAFSPDTVYGVTKATGDFLGNVYARQKLLDVVSLRPCLVYGPRRPSYEPTREMIRGALTGTETVLPAGPDLPHQAVYARDVARAVLALLDARELPRRAYNVTGGETITLGQLAERVSSVLPDLRVRFRSDSPPAEPRPIIDISAMSRDFSYRPAWPLERGIPDYLEWLRRHPV